MASRCIPDGGDIVRLICTVCFRKVFEALSVILLYNICNSQPKQMIMSSSISLTVHINYIESITDGPFP